MDVRGWAVGFILGWLNRWAYYRLKQELEKRTKEDIWKYKQAKSTDVWR